jgi:hypothetical protein
VAVLLTWDSTAWIYQAGNSTRGIVVVKELCCKLEGRWFETR